jgi:pyruvate/2-oxoglutarate/acetoin dehydrogenase E1 component
LSQSEEEFRRDKKHVYMCTEVPILADGFGTDMIRLSPISEPTMVGAAIGSLVQASNRW